MFWGLVMEPNKRYSQTVENSFHVSMASLDITTADDGVVQVMLCYGDRNYLLCSLRKSSTWQVPLDLNFQEGTKIAFTCNGQGHVHLTGYLLTDDDMDELEDEYIEDAEDTLEKLDTLVAKRTKRKAAESPKSGKEMKRVKHESESSDDDDEMEMMDEEDSEDSENEDDVQDEQDDDDSDEYEGEDEEEDEKNEQKKPTKVQLQVQQHEKKGKQKQQQKKHEKQKLLNGKEIKQDQQNKQKKNKADISGQQQKESKKKVIEGGVQVEDLQVGNGAPAKPGKFVSVYYIGRLKNGKKFDSTTQGAGFKFRLGKGEVIKGWDVGLAGMKVGGKRRVTIPPNMAYGAKGSPPEIPGNSTLIFDIELKNVH